MRLTKSKEAEVDPVKVEQECDSIRMDCRACNGGRSQAQHSFNPTTPLRAYHFGCEHPLTAFIELRSDRIPAFAKRMHRLCRLAYYWIVRQSEARASLVDVAVPTDQHEYAR
jgi:hypothetical protein